MAHPCSQSGQTYHDLIGTHYQEEVNLLSFEPPHPARVKIEQAVHTAEALARGEPNRSRIALTLFRDKIRRRRWLTSMPRPRRAQSLRL
jgi:hypothetical protein